MLLEELDDPLLLEEDGAALRLGRVRRQDDVDLLRGERRADILRRDARLDDLIEGRLEGWERRSLVLHVGIRAEDRLPRAEARVRVGEVCVVLREKKKKERERGVGVSARRSKY